MSVNETDHFHELRESLDDEDEPLFTGSNAHPMPTAPLIDPRPSSSPSKIAPPPLPSKKAPAAPMGGPTAPPRIGHQTGFKHAAARAEGAQVSVESLPAIPELPPAVYRPDSADPFQEPAEPRLTAGADQEERLRIFRSIIRGKEEALTRGRSMYQAVDTEAQQLRVVAQTLKAQLESAYSELQSMTEQAQQIQVLKDMLEKDTIRVDETEKRMDELVGRLASAEAQSRSLAAELADAQARERAANAHIDTERREREFVIESLDAAKEQSEHASNEVRRIRDTLVAVTQERDLLADDLSLQVKRVADLEAQISAHETEPDSHDPEAEMRVTALEAQLRETQNVARHQLVDMQERASTAIDAVHEAEARLEAQQAEIDRLHREIDFRKSAAADLDDELKRLQSEEIVLKARLAELEQITEGPTKETAAVGSAAEIERLKADNANLKKKLVTAESAFEAAASLKAKVARLEAQLKGVKR